MFKTYLYYVINILKLRHTLSSLRTRLQINRCIHGKNQKVKEFDGQLYKSEDTYTIINFALQTHFAFHSYSRLNKYSSKNALTSRPTS